MRDNSSGVREPLRSVALVCEFKHLPETTTVLEPVNDGACALDHVPAQGNAIRDPNVLPT